MDAAHDLLPHGDGGFAGIDDLLVVPVAGPHRRAVIGRVAHEILVVVGAGGTGLAGDGHAAEAGGGGGAGGDDALEELVHEVGGGLLHGHVGLGLIVQQHLALVVRHLHIETGGVVDAVVGEGGVGRGHLLGGDAVGEAAHAQGAAVQIIVDGVLLRRDQGGEAQVLCHEPEGVVHAQLLHRPHRYGVDGLGDGGGQRHHAAVAGGGVPGPGVVIQHPDGIVVKDGGRSDDIGIQRRGVHRHGLDGRAALLAGVRGVVEQHVALLGPHVAHHGHHVAVGDVHDGDGGFQLLAGAGGDVHVVVLIDVLGDGLDLRVDGGVDLAAAVEDLPLRLRSGDAQGLRQIVGDIGADLIHEPGLVAGGGLSVVDALRQGLVGGGGALHKVKFLRLGGVGLLLGDEAQARLLVGHFVQNQFLALLIQLSWGLVAVFGLDRDGGERPVHGRVVGDGDEAGALRQIQLLHVLAEVVLGRRLDAVAALAQIDGIEIHLQDGLLGVLLLKLQCPEDLRDLPLDGALVVPRQVLQQLLGNGGPAVGVGGVGEHVHRGADGAPPVHAVVLEEALVLDGHRRLPQLLREVRILLHDAVFLIVERLELDPLPAVLVLIVDDGGLVHGVVIGVHIQAGGQGGLHILHEDTGDHAAGQHADEQDGKEDEADAEAPLPFLSLGALMLSGIPAGRTLLGQFSSSVFH